MKAIRNHQISSHFSVRFLLCRPRLCFVLLSCLREHFFSIARESPRRRQSKLQHSQLVRCSINPLDDLRFVDEKAKEERAFIQFDAFQTCNVNQSNEAKWKISSAVVLRSIHRRRFFSVYRSAMENLFNNKKNPPSKDESVLLWFIEYAFIFHVRNAIFIDFHFISFLIARYFNGSGSTHFMNSSNLENFVDHRKCFSSFSFAVCRN